MDTYAQANLALWNEWAAIHEKSPFYRLAEFKAGESSLHPIELAELGDVAGKSLLHLQCHFGMDTLSWARLGARVTGVDFSDRAIALAHALAQETGLAADFVCCDLYDLPQLLTGQFDVVFTSYGVLSWLRDLPRWGQIVAHYLKPGGIFYVAELHPFAFVFDDAQGVSDLRVAYSYFPQETEPIAWPVQGSYADRTAQVSQPVAYEWTYTLGDVLNALIGAGLRIEFLHEFPVCVDQMLSCMEQGADGWFRLKEKHGAIPFLFSVKATKSHH